MGLLKRYKAAPLPSSFFLASILGILITAFYLWNNLEDPSWSFTFLLVFVLMFIASIISMRNAPADAQLEIDNALKKSK